jgi:MFS transporter, ACS family, aldohexuronate transporter
MGPPLVPAGRAPAWAWGVVWLLFLATVINYMDRQTVGVLSGPIKAAFTSDGNWIDWDRVSDGLDEALRAVKLDWLTGQLRLFEAEPGPGGRRHLSEQGYGTVEFAFSITFATFQIVAGYLVDRRSLRWLYAGALLVWSAAGFVTGLARTVEMLLLCRIVLGLGEAFNWPCAITAIQRTMPREQRSLANGIFHSGASIGAIVTPLLVMVMVGPGGAGWQTVFLVVGAGGFAWAALWFGALRGERAAAVDRPGGAAVTAAAPRGSFWRLFALRTMWITLAVGITVNIFWHFCRVWLPRYLEKDLGLGFVGPGETATVALPWGTWHPTPKTISLLIQSGFYVAADAGSLLAGWWTRRIIHAGWRVESARKLVALGTSLVCLLAIPAMAVGKSALWVTVPLMFLVAAGAMGGFANYFALTQEVSARHTAQVTGFAGAMAWYLIAVMQPRVGAAADRLGTFVPLFMGACCVPLVGAAAGLFWPAHRDEKA